MEVHPAIKKKIEDLFQRAHEMVSAHQRNVNMLLRAIEARDLYSVKVRVAEVISLAPKLHWMTAQIETLKNLPHEMAMADMGQRLSSTPAPWRPNLDDE